MQTLTRIFRAGRVVVGSGVLLALASCGGSGSDNGGPPPVAPPVATIPPSASASSLGFIAYLKTLVVTQQDTVEPLDTTGFVAPTDDASEPDLSI